MRRAGFRLLPVAFVAVLSYLRDPALFQAPRFWAEEGTNYFQSALTRSFLAGLLNVGARVHAQYLHPIPQLATVVAAHCLPLELAPLATTVAWAGVLLLLELVVAFGRAELLDPPAARLLVACSPLLAVGSSENWVNTLGTHFYCDVALVLLLLEGARVEETRRTVSIVGFAVLSFLSPTSWLLVPAVALLSYRDWNGYRPHVVALSGAIGVHALVHFVAFPHSSRPPPDFPVLPHVFVSKLIAWPLLGHGEADAYGNWADGLPETGFAVAAGCAIFAILAFSILVLAASRRDVTTSVLLVTWLSAALGYLLLGLEVGRNQLSAYSGGRYAFLPSMLLLLLIGHQVAGAGLRMGRRIAFGVLLAGAMVVGISEYQYPEGLAAQMSGRSWLAEVRHFREDASYDHLHIAPPSWFVEVPSVPPR